MDPARRVAEEILRSADIVINGDRAWDLEVKDERFFGRVLAGGSLALGESYMDGWWECDALDELVRKILAHDLQEKVRPSLKVFLLWLRASISNRQSRSRAYNIGERHYDLGNDLYRLMLDSGMNYSCGYWKRAKTLDEAQSDKLDLVCRKIGSCPGHAGSGHRVRVGRVRTARGREVRGVGRRHHRVPGTGTTRPGAVQGPAGGDPSPGLPRP